MMRYIYIYITFLVVEESCRIIINFHSSFRQQYRYPEYSSSIRGHAVTRLFSLTPVTRTAKAIEIIATCQTKLPDKIARQNCQTKLPDKTAR